MRNNYSICSAPGKIHLIGEHSSVYGRPAILCAIDKRVTVKIEKDSKPVKSKGAFLEIQKYLHKRYNVPIENFDVESEGNLSIGRGLGSSAAYSAALAACLFRFYQIKFDLDEIYKTAYEGEKFFHGNPSGGDLAACVYGGVVYFRKETDQIKFYKKITPKKDIKFFAIDSGKSEESTKEMVTKVSKLPIKKVREFCHNQELLTKKMANELIQGLDISKTVTDAELNLEKLGIVGLTARKIIKQLKVNGFVAKISGGGGVKKGSGMILVLGTKKLKTSDFNAIKLQIENEGVRIEE